MTHHERTLVGSAKKDEISFAAALRIAKDDVEGAKAYARLNPVSTINSKWGGNVVFLVSLFGVPI